MNPTLEMQVSQTQAGLYTVTYVRKEASLDAQETSFAANGLEIVSPAQLGFLRAQGPEGTFNHYSRTNADVLYDDRTDKVVIFPNGALNSKLGIASIANLVDNLVDAHRQKKEYVISEAQRDKVYAMVDEMLRSGIAFVAPHGQTDVSTSKFGQTELTSKLFSDKSLGIEAQDYGNWLQSQKRNAKTFLMDRKDYSRAQKAPYLNRLCFFVPGGDFFVFGIGKSLASNYGAFGVRFEKTAEVGAKK